jgi:hypothetical protein
VSHPTSTADRVQKRELILRLAVDRARREARSIGRSIRCGQYDNHAPAGCQGEPANCLCECHDPA